MAKKAFFYALALAGQLGFLIAVPLVILALLGRFLDKLWDTSPAFLLLGMVAAGSFSGYQIFKKVKQIQKSQNNG